ncbi:hypothetical protein EDC01DRAFT_86463 [Geopyxis carbonaria]|nr:hypothetical protein EDC01DRAFT_86463 [Geopyxis carbonaria]
MCAGVIGGPGEVYKVVMVHHICYLHALYVTSKPAVRRASSISQPGPGLVVPTLHDPHSIPSTALLCGVGSEPSFRCVSERHSRFRQPHAWLAPHRTGDYLCRAVSGACCAPNNPPRSCRSHPPPWQPTAACSRVHSRSALNISNATSAPTRLDGSTRLLRLQTKRLFFVATQMRGARVWCCNCGDDRYLSSSGRRSCISRRAQSAVTPEYRESVCSSNTTSLLPRKRAGSDWMCARGFSRLEIGARRCWEQ